MALGGFIATKFTWSGGRTGSIQENCEYVLQNMIDKLINLNQGWSLNAEHGEIGIFSNMCGNDFDKKTVVGSLLDHTTGAQLFLSYCASSSSSSSFNTDDFFPSQYQNQKIPGYVSGLTLVMGATPGQFTFEKNLQDTTNLSFTVTPSAETTVVFSSSSTTQVANATDSFAYENAVNTLYSYTWVVRQAVIFLVARSSTWSTTVIKCVVCGPLLGAQSYVGEPYTNLAVIKLSADINIGGGKGGERDAPPNEAINSESSNVFACTLEQAKTHKYIRGFFHRNTTDIKRVTSGDFTDGGYLYADAYSVSSEIQDTSILGRIVPIACGICSTNPAVYGVVPGDGFKGFLNTEILGYTTRGVYMKGQVFDDGKRIYLGGGVVMGWDPSNSVNIFEN